MYQRQPEHVFYTAWSFPFALGIIEGYLGKSIVNRKGSVSFLPSRIKCQERMFTFLQLQTPGRENVTEGLKGEVP